MDFEESQQVFLQLVDLQLLPEIMQQKLQLLNYCIIQAQVDVSMFDQLDPIDCEALISLNEEAQRQMFMQICKGFAMKYFIPCNEKLELEGDIDVKTKTLGRWKARQFQLNVKQCTFEIKRKNKAGKKKKAPRMVNLPYYKLEIMDPSKGRNRFCLQAIKDGQGYYKKLVCGSTDKKLCSTLTGALKNCCYNDPGLKKSSFISDLLPAPRLYQSYVPAQQYPRTQDKHQSVIIQSEQQRYDHLEQKQQNKSIKSSSVQKKESPIIQNVRVQPVQYKSEQYEQVVKEPETVQPLVVEKQKQLYEEKKQQLQEGERNSKQCSEIETKEQSQEEVIQKQQEVLKKQQPQLEQQRQQSQEEIKIQQQPEQQLQQPQLQQQQPQYIQVPKEQYKLDVDESHQIKKSKSHQPETVDPKVNLQDQRPAASPVTTKDFTFPQEDQKLVGDDDEDFKSVEDLDSKEYPHLFKNLVEEGKLEKEYFNSTAKQFIPLSAKDNMQILRSSQNPLCFRVILDISCDDLERVFQSMAEVEFMKKWNGAITDESKCINLIDQTAVMYEKRKQYGMFYLPRDYVYVRYVEKKDSGYWILDKSIEHEEAPQYFRVIRGEVNYSIIRIEPKQVFMEIEITNGGFSSTEQDGQITMVYLQEFKNLNTFLKTYQTSQLIQSPLLTLVSSVHVKSSEQSRQPSKEENFQDFQDLPQNQDRTQSFDEQIGVIQRKLTMIPTTATFEYTENDQQQKNQRNEVQDYNKEIEDQDEEFQDAEIIELPFLATTHDEPQKEEILKQIQMIQDEAYYSNCIHQKYQMEPQIVEVELLKVMEGGHFFLRKDWQRDTKNGGLLFHNAQKIEAQKRVIKFMLKKIGSNLLSGKSILSVSMPVEIFETRSNLERFAYSFAYGPSFLEVGGRMATPQEQMKQTITFGMSSIIMYLSLEKPFNPILGETYQGVINGCPVFVEQVSHHPPTCAFQMMGRGYTLDGHIESQANMHANSVTGKNVGYLRVIYHNTGAKQIFIMVPGTLFGTAFGERFFNLAGKQFGIDMENNIISECTFNPGKSMFSKKSHPQDYYVGGIYRVKSSAITRYRKDGYKSFAVSGIWNQYMEIDEVQTWNLSMYPHKLRNHPNPLPSDSNYRLDILWWKLKDFDQSQKNKEIMENKQRADKKLREKHSGKKH